MDSQINLLHRTTS